MEKKKFKYKYILIHIFSLNDKILLKENIFFHWI